MGCLPLSAGCDRTPRAAAGAEGQRDSGGKSLVDRLGRSIPALPLPGRVVSLAPSTTETLFALGAEGLLVGRDPQSNYPPEALKVPSVGATFPRLSPETVLRLRPELVLAAGTISPEDVELLSRLGLRVYAATISEHMGDVYADLRAIATLVGREADGEALIAQIARRVQELQKRLEGVERPRVYYELDATDSNRPWIPGRTSFIAELIRLAGGENIGDSREKSYVQIGIESLLAAGPDVIIVGASGERGARVEAVLERSSWRTLEAIRSGRVHVVDDDLVSRPGPRVVEGLEALARVIHPERFP